NLWLGGESGGAMRIAATGITSFDEADGLRGLSIRSIFEDNFKRLCVVDEEKYFIHRFDGKRFSAVRPHLSLPRTNYGWGWYQHALQDRWGEWWLPTRQGLYRFSKTDRLDRLANATPKAIYTTQNGLPVSNFIFRLFEDSRKDLWISTGDVEGSGL